AGLGIAALYSGCAAAEPARATRARATPVQAIRGVRMVVATIASSVLPVLASLRKRRGEDHPPTWIIGGPEHGSAVAHARSFQRPSCSRSFPTAFATATRFSATLPTKSFSSVPLSVLATSLGTPGTLEASQTRVPRNSIRVAPMLSMKLFLPELTTTPGKACTSV